MKNAIAIGFMAASFLALVGAGCAPKVQSPPAAPAVQAPPGSATTETVPSGKKTDLTQDDLNKFKRDVQALQVQDLTTLKQ